MANSSEFLSGANQLAALLAQRNQMKGLSGDPADYHPLRVKFSGAEFNSLDPKYRSDLVELGFLIGGRAIGAEGVQVIILGMMSGVEEKDRVTVDGKDRRFAIWKTQPEVVVVPWQRRRLAH